MSLKYLVEQFEYIVTVHDSHTLDDVYNDLETQDVSPSDTEITRSVKCAVRRPDSKNTHYYLTEWEANQLKQDPRIKSVELHPKYLGIEAGENHTIQQSDYWNKSSGVNSLYKNFALLRCTEGEYRLGWGLDGTPNASGTISLSATGRNVDVVIVDGNGIEPEHPEFAVNEDGTGGSRVIQYNWYQHNPEVTGGSAGTYSYPTGTSASYHAVHVMGTVAGNTQGWARDANLYNLYYYAGAIGDSNFPYVMDYVRAFHRNKNINPETGIKNPTITNNSWGMSIFPQSWSFADITAVTYRGTRYTVNSGDRTFSGENGVYSASTQLAEFAVGPYESINKIVTTNLENDLYNASILEVPTGWTTATPISTTYETTSKPSNTYVITVDVTDLEQNISVFADVAAAVEGAPLLPIGNIDITMSINVVGPTSNSATSNTTGLQPEPEVILEHTHTCTETGEHTVTIVIDIIEDPDVTTPTYAGSFAVNCDLVKAAGAEVFVEELPYTPIPSITGLNSSTTPTIGGRDDGYWNLNFPWIIEYLGTSYSNVYVGTNMYLTFGSGSSVYSGISATNPPFPKIMVGAADNSIQRVYYGTEGTLGSREYRIVIEGTASTGGTLGSPTMRFEYRFYENETNRIDLTVDDLNARSSTTGSFSNAQLNAWGFIAGQRIPVPVSALDSDIEDAMDEGIIFVGAAGNGRWKHDVPGGPDWDNTFEMGNRYPSSVSSPYYYMRGTSPTRNDNTVDGTFDLPMITVGALDATYTDQKVSFSDCGPGVDIWAPGTYIMSSWNGSTVTTRVTDPRDSNYTLAKISGTSMASPQVCGVLSCLLETYPFMNQEQAKEYLINLAKDNQVVATSGGPTDIRDLQGAPNKFLYYKQERPETGDVYPKKNFKTRPENGRTWPRPRIRRK
jgi:hypothetical protein